MPYLEHITATLAVKVVTGKANFHIGSQISETIKTAIAVKFPLEKIVFSSVSFNCFRIGKEIFSSSQVNG